MSKNDLIRELQELALGTRLKRLSDMLMLDVGKIYKEQELDFEPRWFTMLYLLQREKSLSIIDIADQLRLSHPAVVQFADQMQKQKIVTAKKDKNDARKRILSLSEKGEKIYEKLQPILVEVEKATRELVQSSGVDVLYAIEKMEKQLENKSMFERIKEGLKTNLLHSVEIKNYHPKYNTDFKNLNEEWLKAYFEIEKEDIKILNNPEKYIIDKGGEIFFAVHHSKVIGTLALTPKDNKHFELSKMAVTKAYQGNSVGSLLIENALSYAKKKKAKHVSLETNRKLSAAIHLYEKFGFVRVNQSVKSKYKRSNLKMETDI